MFHFQKRQEISILMLMYSVCCTADVPVAGIVGGSVELTARLEGENISHVQWYYGDIVIAEILDNKLNYYDKFSNRLELSSDNFNLIVKQLSLADGGEYKFTGTIGKNQIPTQIIKLIVYEPITEVMIQSELSWSWRYFTCMVNLACNASGSSPNITWESENQTESCARLQFSLSPAEHITFNCTAANHVSRKSRKVTLRCLQTTESVGVAVGGALFLIIVVSLLVFYCKKRNTVVEFGGKMTTYADINPSTKTTRPESQSDPMTLYETVSDVTVAQRNQPCNTVQTRPESQSDPMTLYETVSDVTVAQRNQPCNTVQVEALHDKVKFVSKP